MTTFTTELPVRFRDIDAMGHVNNAVYATYLEQARTEYYREVLDVTLDEIDSVLASLSLEFDRPITLSEERVTVAVDVPELGTSSIPMEYTIRTDAGVAATGESVQVLFDRETESSVPIPDDWRAVLVDYHELGR